MNPRDQETLLAAIGIASLNPDDEPVAARLKEYLRRQQAGRVDCLPLANKVTKALFPDLYGKPTLSTKQVAQLMGSRGVVLEVLEREFVTLAQTTQGDGEAVLDENELVRELRQEAKFHRGSNTANELAALLNRAADAIATAPSHPYQWPAFEIVQKWTLENGYSGASDDEAYQAYRKAHPSPRAEVKCANAQD